VTKKTDKRRPVSMIDIALKISENDIVDLSMFAQIREAFDTIVDLQKKGMQLSAIVDKFNDAGIQISINYLKLAMTKIRMERKKNTQNSTPTLSQDIPAPTTQSPTRYINQEKDIEI
jgi:hypothetical protein